MACKAGLVACAAPPTICNHRTARSRGVKHFARQHSRYLTTYDGVVARSGGSDLITVSNVETILAARGMTLKISELGPLYRVLIRDGSDDKILAVTNGWVDPILRYMHCEALQVFTKGLKGSEGERIRNGALGLGLLLGMATFAYAHSRHCTRAEILAIKDYDYQHQRLVKYYSFFGFQKVKEVGDGGLADLFDQVAWGGVGTRMDADVIEMLQKWSPALQRKLQGLRATSV